MQSGVLPRFQGDVAKELKYEEKRWMTVQKKRLGLFLN
jgi:hypothetical protein